MKLIVNGARCECAADTLDALLAELGHEGTLVATAVNADFVPRDVRGHTRLAEGDTVEILSPMQGG